VVSEELEPVGQDSDAVACRAEIAPLGECGGAVGLDEGRAGEAVL
jgi:hypothetical protein